MNPILRNLVGAVSGMLLLAGTAQAHYLWIESSDTGGKLYFGEAETLLKEKSPGRLDNIKGPKAMVRNPQAAQFETVPIQREGDHFSIAAKPSSSILVAEESLEVRDLTKHGLGLAKSNYYARHGQLDENGKAQQLLRLDLRRQAPNVFTVLYQGKPLANAKLEVIAPNTWMQEHKTNAQGVVEVNTPWRGQYVIHVLHVDSTPGDFAGARYTSLRNHFTYSFFQATGSDPGPAIAPRQIED